MESVVTYYPKNAYHLQEQVKELIRKNLRVDDQRGQNIRQRLAGYAIT